MSLLPVGFGASGDDYEITDSLRLRSSASAYLSRTPASTSDRTEWTWSGWVKKGPNATNLSLFSADHAGGSNAYLSMLINNSDEFQIFEYTGSAYTLRLATNALFRDPSAWYHFVCAVDTDQGTSTNRIKLYVNGVQQTSLRLSTYPSSGHTTYVNVSGNLHAVGATVGASTSPDRYLDGYLTEVNFIDGQQLTPSDFGEYDANGTWKAKEYTGTYGTNGFYLPMKPTTQATGQNTVLYAGDGGTQSINGVGFSPDLVWIKSRDYAYSHALFDSVRGVSKWLPSNGANAEATVSGVTSFDSDGFTLGADTGQNDGSKTYVAWCWDAGSGSPVSNTVGSINSTVKANDATGFSIVTYSANGSTGTIGHGLSSAPELIIVKKRNAVERWTVYHQSTSNAYIYLNETFAAETGNANLRFGNNSSVVAPTSSVFTVGNSNDVNGSGGTYVAYCFSEVSGVSKFDSYTGTGSSGKVVTTGFRPAFVMIKRTDTGSRNWIMMDSIRDPGSVIDMPLYANLSNTEVLTTTNTMTFDANGFTLTGFGADTNTNGGTYIYMAFADTADARFNFDASGNKNNWLPNNINSNGESETTYDLMKDTPSLVDENAANFAVLNPLNDPRTYVTYSDGNLTAINTTAALHSPFIGTIGMAANSGKYYWEVIGVGDANTRNSTGIGTAASMNTTTVWSYVAGQAGLFIGGAASVYYSLNGSTLWSVPWVSGNVIQYAYDANTGKFWAGQNNVWYNSTGGTTGDPATGANPTSTLSNTDLQFPGGTVFNQGVGSYLYHNFGQRPFAYTPPSGFLKLNTFNLPDSTIEDGSDYFNTVLYTGNNASGRNIPTGFPGGWTWIKNRNAANSHTLSDVVRGDGKTLFTNATNAEVDYGSNGIDLVSDGFDVTHNSTNNLFNVTGRTYVAWNWKANGSGVSNNVGSIPSTVSANTTAGFSVVSWSGNSTNGATIGHGIGTAPNIILTKCRSHATSWIFGIGGMSGFGVNDYFNFQTTGAKSSSSTFYQAYSANTFQVGVSSADEMNKTGRTYVSYCFAPVEGYSSFGSYTGNGSTDGPFVYTGFKPAFVITKRTNAASGWPMHDDKRSPYNVTEASLYANALDAEVNPSTEDIDFLSNGFKMRGTTTARNSSGSTYIYIAFAENPFKNSNAR